MGEATSIEWCHHTFNIVWGCDKVSPACKHCYAEAWAKRMGFDVWGKDAPRRTFGEKHWREPLKWNEAAARAGEQRRVFCSSMADVFEDHPVLAQERLKLWPLISRTGWLDWLLLTKRPENINGTVPWGHDRPNNVWLGTTVEDRERAEERIPWLQRQPAAVRFLSVEPLLEDLGELDLGGIHWVIVGGESGGKARPFDLAWARSIRDQCRRDGVAFFCKQLGVRPSDDGLIRLSNKKGGDWTEWPMDLRIREFPRANVR